MSEILSQIRTLFETKGDAVEQWLAAQRRQASPYVYTSVDLRHSGKRLVPVDTNLFPAGFNNLSPAATERAGRYFQSLLSERFPAAKKILLIPENHTRNLSYLQNLWCLKNILEDAGVEVVIGSLIAEKGQPMKLTTSAGNEIVEYALAKENGRIVADGGFIPDVVLMNNDMTKGIPDVIQNISQPVIPSPQKGWWQRRKSVHFCAYQTLVKSFSAEFGLDSWLINAEFYQCGVVDFKERTGLDCVAKGVDKVLAAAREKHSQYGIKDDPYVYVKADSGTYGMGIMTVRSGSEMLELNKKDRNKMHTIKEGAQVNEVIIQEGIPTIDRVDDKPAEPMVYMVDGLPVGGMYRINGQRDAQNNLNAAGVEFTGMCDEDEKASDKQPVVGCHFRSFGLIAALAALAAPREQYGIEEKERRLRCQPCA